MSDIAIQVNHLSKKFHRGQVHDSLRDLIPAIGKRLLGRTPPQDELSEGDYWALKDISFAVERGEALGIMGPNGAGKSTLLKLLAKILRPTSGQCMVHGRVGALIEVSAGFHPDLTGRENIFLQGAILGMKRFDISRKLEMIIEFAGVAEFIDTPIKRYSSGMQARLGFSVAAHLDPEVLIIDEVLSVGDMVFQERCIERMNEFKRSGTAILFVSHNLQAIARLCTTGIYLQHEVQAIGPVHEVVEAYVTASHRKKASDKAASFEIVAAELMDHCGGSTIAVRPGAQLKLRVTYLAHEAVSDVTLGLVLYRSSDNLTVYHGNVHINEFGCSNFAAGEKVTVDFFFVAHVTRGHYYLECHAFHNPTYKFLSRLLPAGMFIVEETRTYEGPGVADLELKFTLVSKIVAAGEEEA